LRDAVKIARGILAAQTAMDGIIFYFFGFRVVGFLLVAIGSVWLIYNSSETNLRDLMKRIQDLRFKLRL
jgi:hypothetical protein